jgi:hypothetical protein
MCRCIGLPLRQLRNPSWPLPSFQAGSETSAEYVRPLWVKYLDPIAHMYDTNTLHKLISNQRGIRDHLGERLHFRHVGIFSCDDHPLVMRLSYFDKCAWLAQRCLPTCPKPARTAESQSEKLDLAKVAMSPYVAW